MNKLMKRGAVAFAALTLVGVGTAAVAAPDDADHKIRKTDFTASSDTRAGGALGFADDGSLVIRTQSNTSADKVAEYFALPLDGLPDSASVDWTGSTPEPGVQIVFDADDVTGNGNDFNILVGEKVYGDDFWLTNGSSQTAKDAAPSHAGGSGSDNHGTLEQWQEALPNAQVREAGFSLGSGVKGDGVLKAVEVNGINYTFEDDPKAAAPPAEPETVNSTATVTPSISPDGQTVGYTMKTSATPAGAKQGTVPKFKVMVNTSTTMQVRVAPGTTATYNLRCPGAKTKCDFRVFKDGVQQGKTITVNK